MTDEAPDVEFTAAMAVADRELQATLGDEAVWAEEAARADAAPLVWPPRFGGAEGRAGLLASLAVAAAENVLVSMYEARSGAPEPEDPRWRARLRCVVDHLDPAADDVQIMFRVIARAVARADAALVRQFGGAKGSRRLTGKREWTNWLKAEEVDRAVRCGLSRGEALQALGISRAGAYRAMNRAKKKQQR